MQIDASIIDDALLSVFIIPKKPGAPEGNKYFIATGNYVP
jgi:hypothetical protein